MLLLEILANALDIAEEELIGGGVIVNADGLGEIDQPGAVIVIEDVVGGEVAVDVGVGEEQLDVPEDSGEKLLRDVALEAQGMERGSAPDFVAEVLHQDRVVAVGER